MKKIVNWHKSMIERAQKEFGLSGYQMYLSGLLEGALILWVIMRVSSMSTVNSDIPF